MKNSRNYLVLNLIFIFLFLNAWDWAISNEYLNAMLLGIFFFGPICLLWLWGKFKATVLVTLISIFEFLMLTTFVLEGLQLSGTANTLKSVYWFPFLVAAGVNGFWGLKIYSQKRKI